jgi:predicted HD phosphohydrolase
MTYTKMSTAPAAELNLNDAYIRRDQVKLPDRLLAILNAMDERVPGVPITRYEHSIQSATRAHRASKDEEYVIAALFHDIGDDLAPYYHGEYCAAILRPYVSERLAWIVATHATFQLFYYGHKVGLDRNARDQYRDHPWYVDGVEFCAKYDQNCFDPDYESLPLEFFEPMVRRVLAQPTYLQ